MGKSIVQQDKVCYITRSPFALHKHHVFYGRGVREVSEKYGLWVWLRADWHNASDKGVHFNKSLDTWLKRKIQQIAMEHYGWTVEEFIEKIGRNYLC